MTYEAKKIGIVEGLGEIYQVSAPLDEQIKVFQEVGIPHPYLATPEQIARIRLAGISNDFSRTSIAPIALKGEPTILTKDSPLMNSLIACYAVECHRDNVYPLFSKEVYEGARKIAKSEEGKNPEERKAIILSKNGDFNLTPEMPESKFLLGQNTEEYFERFTKGKINFYGINSDLKDKTLINYLWFDYPQVGSVISARYGDLNNGDRSFGGAWLGRSPCAEKIYTIDKIGNSLRQLGFSGLEKQLFENLQQ